MMNQNDQNNQGNPDSEIPVYLFFGFMDGGKTTLIKETLLKNGFAAELSRILLIVCEDGDEEYDEEELKRHGVFVEWIEKKEDFTEENLAALSKKHNPEAVFIEYNGTWEVAPVYEMEGPPDWTIVQALASVDASTFESYMLNMGVMIKEQLFKAEVIIFNRCTENTPKAKFRANIKSFNRPAQIVYERTDGSVDNSEEELPFDLSKEELEISDADYALWFMDCMDNPKKYDGKIVHFLGQVYNPKEGKGMLAGNTFVPGRFAMTCCVEDIQFLGMKCKYADSKKIPHKSWVDIRAKVKNEFAMEYRGKGPVLYPVDVKEGVKPEDELVYFS